MEDFLSSRFSPVNWATIAAGSVAVLALTRLLRPTLPATKEDYYDEDELYADFASAARMDEVRPGRTVRVLVLDSSQKSPSGSAGNVTVQFPLSASMPAIFLVHGANARMAQMYPVARKLQGLGYRIVMYDAYGSGRTEKPREWTAYSSEQHKLDFDVIFAKYAAGDGKNFVVGHSFGSVLAVHIAGKETRKVAGIMLLSSAHHVPQGGHPVLKLPEWFLSLSFMRKLLGNGFRKLAFHANADPALHHQHEMMGKNNTIFAVRAFAAQLKWMDDAMLQRVSQPVFVVHGAQDMLLKLDNARRLQDKLSNLKSMQVIEGCSHMPMMEKPAETCEAIRAAVEDTWANLNTH